MASDAQISRDDLIAVINDIAWRYPDDAPSLADSLLHHYRIQGKVLHPVTLEDVAAPAPAVDREALRQEAAEVLHEQMCPCGWGLHGCRRRDAADYLEWVDSVLAVPPVDRLLAAGYVRTGPDRDELAFLVERVEQDRRGVNPRCYGRSSDALAWYGCGRGHEPDLSADYPRDEDDLRACELTYEMAPPHVQERMLPVLEKFRESVRGTDSADGER